MKPTYMWGRATRDVQRKCLGDYRWSTSRQLYERGSRHVKKHFTRQRHARMCQDMFRAGMLFAMRNKQGTWEYAYSIPEVGLTRSLPSWRDNVRDIENWRVDTARNGIKEEE